MNPKGGGVVRVAFLTTETLDAKCVDPATVEFVPSGATPLERFAHFDDVDHDEDANLVLRFRASETGIECGDESASLTGMNFDEQGIDSINSVGCK